MNAQSATIRRALISVSDKSHLEDFAKALHGFGVEILASGGTAERLRRANIPYRAVESVTGNPEAFDGRMKTISFQLESGILFDRRNATHVEQARTLGIEPIDLVVCNFYPFQDAVARGASEEELISEIDVGGPTMVRAAAKNFQSVAVVVDPSDYQAVTAELRALGGGLSVELRRRLMIKAFDLTHRYDQAIFETFAKRPLRYGENPHQGGAFVPDQLSQPALRWELIEPAGLELSYNNILDAQAAFGAVRDAWAAAPQGYGACAIIKHNNPCGLATARSIDEAFVRAWAGDPVSSFGGVVAFSAPMTLECARLFEEKFVEVVLAPGFEEGALAELRRKKKKLRVIKIDRLEPRMAISAEYPRVRVEGGYLIQPPDENAPEALRCVTKAQFKDEELGLAKFAVVCAKWIKSNAIAIARRCSDGGFQLVGMGSGQPNRVDAVGRLALPKAAQVLELVEGRSNVARALSECVLASDAFFPFADSIEEAARAGIRKIVQPGGSIRDAEVIAACDKLGIAMLMTGVRHFRH